jgi:preprotein translocase subunit SecG
MYSVILVFHIIICMLLVIVVLLQQSRGGGMSSVFGGGGGGGADSLFGGKGATPFFVKVTSGLAISFFITSLVLVLLSRRPTPQSAVDKAMQEMPVQVPEEGGGPIIPEEPGPVIPEEPGGGE